MSERGFEFTGYGILFGQDPTAEQKQEMLAVQREYLEAVNGLKAKYGENAVMLAQGVINAEMVCGMIEHQGGSPGLILAAQKAFEHLLTFSGSLASIEQDDLAPIVAGLRDHMGIVRTDIDEITQKGDQHGDRSGKD